MMPALKESSASLSDEMQLPFNDGASAPPETDEVATVGARRKKSRRHTMCVAAAAPWKKLKDRGVNAAIARRSGSVLQFMDI
jgi:hypothetical protein